MTMTSIKSIFTYLSLPEDELDNYTIEEWASIALDLLKIRQGYQEKICILNIANHKAKLPNDLLYIQAVAHQRNSPSANQLTKLTESISRNTSVVVEEDGTKTHVNTITSLFTTPGDLQNQDHLLRIQAQGVLNNYQLWAESDLYKSNFQLIKPMTRAFSQMFCDYCPNLLCDSEEYFNIQPDRTIMTSFEEGNICISYLARARNSNNDILIPNDPELKMALAAYVNMRYAMEKMWQHESSMGNMYVNFQREWELLCAKVRGNFIMNEIDPESLVLMHKPFTNVIRNYNAFDNL